QFRATGQAAVRPNPGRRDQDMSAEKMLVEPGEVLAFWQAAGPDKWFTKDRALDAEILARFGAAHEAGLRGELSGWEATPEGTIALLILLDQFPRNMFRGDARAFAADAGARALAERAIARGTDLLFTVPERRFFYLP